MLKNGVRHCDLCDREIANGERYVAQKIEKKDIPPAVNMNTSVMTVDDRGNVSMDICLACRTAMRLSGEEVSD